MTINEQSVAFIIDLVTTNVVDELAKKTGTASLIRCAN